jgi:hypothetical protein
MLNGCSGHTGGIIPPTFCSFPTVILPVAIGRNFSVTPLVPPTVWVFVKKMLKDQFGILRGCSEQKAKFVDVFR